MIMAGNDIAGLREHIKGTWTHSVSPEYDCFCRPKLENATELLESRSGEIWRDSTHRVVVVGEDRKYTAVIKTLVIRIEGPPASTMRKALKKLLKHMASMLLDEKDIWEDMSDNDLGLEEELVEYPDGARYAREVTPEE